MTGKQSHLDARVYLPIPVRRVFKNQLYGLALQALRGEQSKEMTKFFKIIETSIFGTPPEDEKEASNLPAVGECGACEKRFTSQDRWAKHLFAHTFEKKPRNEEFHLCTICGGEFNNRKHYHFLPEKYFDTFLKGV